MNFKGDFFSTYYIVSYKIPGANFLSHIKVQLENHPTTFLAGQPKLRSIAVWARSPELTKIGIKSAQ